MAINTLLSSCIVRDDSGNIDVGATRVKYEGTLREQSEDRLKALAERLGKEEAVELARFDSDLTAYNALHGEWDQRFFNEIHAVFEQHRDLSAATTPTVISFVMNSLVNNGGLSMTHYAQVETLLKDYIKSATKEGGPFKIAKGKNGGFQRPAPRAQG